MIAMALSCNPKVLIADEPTTALDVTIQAQILDLMRELRDTLGTAIILITHDMGVVAENADRVVVMYAGRKVEEANVDDLFERPGHPYTRGLLGSIPSLDVAARAGHKPHAAERDQGHGAVAVQPAAGLQLRAALRLRHRPMPRRVSAAGAAPTRPLGRLLARRRCSERMSGLPPNATPMAAPLLEVENLKKHFPVYKGVFSRVSGQVYAVDGVSFHIDRGETLGLVGESGCGKSTVGRTLLKLLEPTEGKIRVHGKDITDLDTHADVSVPGADADDLPGSLCVAQSAHVGRRHRRRAADHPPGRDTRGTPGARRAVCSSASVCDRST